jgi:hypothetical protein
MWHKPHILVQVETLCHCSIYYVLYGGGALLHYSWWKNVQRDRRLQKMRQFFNCLAQNQLAWETLTKT